MSDSIKKYEEMMEEVRMNSTRPGTTYIYESPDKGRTVTKREIGQSIATREVIKRPFLSEDDTKQAHTILVNYSTEAILEAARILSNGE